MLDIHNCWLKGQFFYQPEVMFTREIWDRAGASVDESLHYCMDYDLWLRLALMSDVALLDEPLVQVRRHEANYTQDWEIAFIGRDHSLEKLQGMVDIDRRVLLRAERTRNALILAARHASRETSCP